MQPKRVWGGLVLLALLDPDDLDELLDNGDIPDWYKDVIREQLEALRDGQVVDKHGGLKRPTERTEAA